MRFPVSASWNERCTFAGAPSPTWQQGAVTTMLTFGLSTPSLVAVTVATPPPAACNTAFAPDASIETTLLLLVLHDTGRSPSVDPFAAVGVAVRVSTSPRLSATGTPVDAPAIATLATGRRCVGPPPPGVYSRMPPSKVCRCTPLLSLPSC